MGLSWAIVLSKSGILESLMPLRQKAERGNKLFPLQVSAPIAGKKTINPKPGFLADKTDYVLGVDPAASGDKKALEKLKKRFELFRNAHLAAQDSISHPDFDSVCEYLKSWNPVPSDRGLRIHQTGSSGSQGHLR